MRLAIVITLAAVSLFAEDKLQPYRNQLTDAVAKADLALDQAKRDRDAQVKRAFKSYLKVLKKAQVYWVKQGDLDRALEVRAEIRKVKTIVGPEKKMLPLVPEVVPETFLPPVKLTTTTDSGVMQPREPRGSYKGINFSSKDSQPKQMMARVWSKVAYWSKEDKRALQEAFVRWYEWRKNR